MNPADDPQQALTERVDAATPPSLPPYDVVLGRRDRRRTRRRAAVVGSLVAVVVGGGAVAVAGDRDGTVPSVATDGTTVTPDDAPTTATTTEAEPDPAVAYPEPEPLGEGPPTLRLRGEDGSTVDAQLGSYCWNNGCTDTVTPPLADLPDAGEAPVLRGAYPTTGQWTVSVRDEDPDSCARYPVLVEPTSDTTLDLTPTGPGGVRYADYFVYPKAGGYVSGAWRWTVPERDGVPLAYLSLSQNTPSSGGGERLVLVLDDAAVDVAVRATVAISTADGEVLRLPLDDVDQHCPGDGFVEVGTSLRMREGVLDALGAAPYTYQVLIRLDGVSYHANGTFSGRHSVAGGDTRLQLESPLPPYGG